MQTMSSVLLRVVEGDKQELRLEELVLHTVVDCPALFRAVARQHAECQPEARPPNS